MTRRHFGRYRRRKLLPLTEQCDSTPENAWDQISQPLMRNENGIIRRDRYFSHLPAWALHLGHSGSTVSLVKATAKATSPQPLQQSGSNCFRSEY